MFFAEMFYTYWILISLTWYYLILNTFSHITPIYVYSWRRTMPSLFFATTSPYISSAKLHHRFNNKSQWYTLLKKKKSLTNIILVIILCTICCVSDYDWWTITFTWTHYFFSSLTIDCFNKLIFFFFFLLNCVFIFN